MMAVWGYVNHAKTHEATMRYEQNVTTDIDPLTFGHATQVKIGMLLKAVTCHVRSNFSF